ncbi:MAG: hypothetical protein ACTSPP_07630 [Candidatus Heimdallarchaeaceae archaeon]
MLSLLYSTRFHDRARVLINALKLVEKDKQLKEDYRITEGFEYLRKQRDKIKTTEDYKKAKKDLSD